MTRSQHLRWLIPLATFSLLLAACSGAAVGTGGDTPTQPPDPTASPVPTEADAGAAGLSCEDPFEGESVAFRTQYWEKTDFCQHSVPYDEIRSGGPPPDGIPAIDNPQFESQEAADEWLGDEWPLMVYGQEGETKAYPLAILIWHEIVNDTVDGDSIAVTYCPLCNAAIVFDREAPDGRVLDFGTSGNLRNLDLVMYDRQTESWWQQLTGEAIVGEYTGAQLEFLPSRTLAWEDVKQLHPDAQVLSRHTGFARYQDRYGFNPYSGYDAPDNPSPLGGNAEENGPVSPMERVVALEGGGNPVAYPFGQLREAQVANDDLAGTPIVVFWQAGVKSVLDSGSLEQSRDVGSAAVFERTVDGDTLTFLPTDDDGVYKDEQTGSRWSIAGVAIDGPLAGSELEPRVFAEHFWFAWSEFFPESEVWTSS